MTHTYWIILNIKERKRYAWWKKKNMVTNIEKKKKSLAKSQGFRWDCLIYVLY